MADFVKGNWGCFTPISGVKKTLLITGFWPHLAIKIIKNERFYLHKLVGKKTQESL